MADTQKHSFWQAVGQDAATASLLSRAWRTKYSQIIRDAINGANVSLGSLDMMDKVTVVGLVVAVSLGTAEDVDKGSQPLVSRGSLV
jgi:hypothetical protein